jgi:hypothetical protein
VSARNGRRLKELIDQIEIDLYEGEGLFARLDQLEEIAVGLSIRVGRLESLVLRLLGSFCRPNQELAELILEKWDRIQQDATMGVTNPPPAPAGNPAQDLHPESAD